MKKRTKTRTTPWVRRRRRTLIVLLVIALCLSPWLVWRLNLKVQVRDGLSQLRAAGVPTSVEAREAWVASFPAREEITHYADAADAYIVLPLPLTANFPTFRSRNEEEEDLFTVPYPEETLGAMREAVALNGAALGHLRDARDLVPGAYTAGQDPEDGLVELICADACVRAADGDGAGAVEAIRGGLLYLERASQPFAPSSAWSVGELDRLLVALFSSAGQCTLPAEGLALIRTQLEMPAWEAQQRARQIDGVSDWLLMVDAIDADLGLQFIDIIFGIFDRQRLMECRAWAFQNELTGKIITEQRAEIEAVQDEPWGDRIRVIAPPLRLDVARTVLDILRFHHDTGTLPATLEDLVPAYCDAVPMNRLTDTPLVYQVDGTTVSVSGSEEDEQRSRRSRRAAVSYRVNLPPR